MSIINILKYRNIAVRSWEAKTVGEKPIINREQKPAINIIGIKRLSLKLIYNKYIIPKREIQLNPNGKIFNKFRSGKLSRAKIL